MTWVAAPEPSAFRKVLDSTKEFISEHTPYFQDDISFQFPEGARAFRAEQPVKTLGRTAAFQAASAASGLSLNALDIIDHKITGDESLAQTVAQLTGYEPTDADIASGRFTQAIAQERFQ
jgi:hypothetical protein